MDGIVCGKLTVKTFPPTTAALSDGERKEFLGMWTLIGFKHPWLSGMSSEIRHLRQYMIAEYVTASGALMFPIQGIMLVFVHYTTIYVYIP